MKKESVRLSRKQIKQIEMVQIAYYRMCIDQHLGMPSFEAIRAELTPNVLEKASHMQEPMLLFICPSKKSASAWSLGGWHRLSFGLKKFDGLETHLNWQVDIVEVSKVYDLAHKNGHFLPKQAGQKY